MAVGFSTLANYFQTYGVIDFLLPFILAFTIIFAVTAKMPLFKDNKNFRLVIALALALTFVVPHITGTYPLGYDPVQVMNDAIPSISLVAIAAIMLLILMGIFGTDFSQSAAPVVALIAIGFVVYIFGSALQFWTGPYDAFSWWTPETTELMIIILVFGLIVYFVTSDPKESSGFKEVLKEVGKLFERR